MSTRKFNVTVHYKDVDSESRRAVVEEVELFGRFSHEIDGEKFHFAIHENAIEPWRPATLSEWKTGSKFADLRASASYQNKPPTLRELAAAAIFEKIQRYGESRVADAMRREIRTRLILNPKLK